MDINIFAKSSSQPESPYKVNFIIKDGLLRIYCSCPAGTYGQLCKHKTSFIEGDFNMLYDISQQQLLDDIVATINASPLKNEYSRFINRKTEIEKIQRKLKKELKDIKNDLAMKLQNGIKI
jgi:hypothetical protein